MMPDHPTLAFRPLADDEIRQLERAPWSSGLKEKHGQRLQRQRDGEVCYLVAWCDDGPIGHLLLKFSGPSDATVAALVTGCAEIEDFVVVPDLRSRGIGRSMLDTAARLTRERGLRRLGLSVGLDNPRARALYEREGFAVDDDCGVVTVRWQGPGEGGATRWYAQECVYLVKGLGEI